MIFNPYIHHRRSIRLRGYDYAKSGKYFITLCSYERARLFGEVINGCMILSELGRIVTEEWLRTPVIRSNVELGEFILMPDHFHGIILILEERNGEHVGANSYSPRQSSQFAPTVTPFRSPSNTIGAIIRGFKGSTTKRVNEMRGTPGVHLWQRNYYDHIIRNEYELDQIRKYMRLNPSRWASGG